MGIFDRVLRAGEGKKLKAIQALVPDINALEPETEALDDTRLKAKTGEFRQRLDNGEEMEDLLVEAFAVVREASKRVIGQRHYDVQLMGGAALHLGWVAEMKTGEGKTLVSTLPAYLNGLTGRGMHIVTVNDYLASRDAEWMGEIHRWLGLTVGLVVPGNFDREYKRAQYHCDITHGTNNELGFDYLRDNMALSRADQVQRGHAYCLVDEVDSILIDEARTPLIISGRVADAAKLYYDFAAIVRGLKRDEHYDVDEEKRVVSPTEDGIEAVERAMGVENIYDGVSQNLVHQLGVALRAKELFHRDKDYLVTDGQVKIVDEFTGRVLDGRRWSDGLHQAVEAKEGVKIKEENQTLATVTLQNYFRMYDKLAGMTGTAETEAAELKSTYGLDVVPVPTNRPIVRDDAADLVYKSEDGKFGAVVDDLLERYKVGQPVLVGTASVEHSEKLSGILNKQGIPHQVLNAKQHTREAHVVAQAGRIGAITVATNMAGRGVDIVLGGNPEIGAEIEVRARGVDPESDEGQELVAKLHAEFEGEMAREGEKVREVGGLHVLGTERHESRRIDNQLRGRAGRQGDPGSSRFYLSLEDDLMRLFATGAMNWVMDRALPDDVPIESKMVSKSVERAQNTVEQRNAEIRQNVLKYDEVMNEQRKVIYKRRDQILDGEDLREEATEALDRAISHVIETYCVADYSEEWDIDGLLGEVRNVWSTELTSEQLAAADVTDDLRELLLADAAQHYEQREEVVGSEIMRDLERQVMLRILDRRWRDHLQEMDYLRDGIGLRAMGQKDPLMEWQREGFEMFGQMMDNVSTDFVTYVLNMNIQVKPPDEQADEPSDVANVSYSAPDSPVQGLAAAQAAQPAAPADPAALPSTGPAPNEPQVNTPVVKSDWDKTGRNEPCPCGSGKKYKHCHGR